MSEINFRFDQLEERLKEDRAEAKRANSELKTALTTMAESMSELINQTARFEEKHAQTEKAMERFGSRLDKSDKLLRSLELKVTSNTFVSGIVAKIAWVVAGAAISGAITTLYIMIR